MRVRVQVGEYREFGLVTRGAHEESQGGLHSTVLPLLEKDARISRTLIRELESTHPLLGIESPSCQYIDNEKPQIWFLLIIGV